MDKTFILHIIIDYLKEEDLEKIKSSEILNAVNLIYELKFKNLKMVYDYIDIKFNLKNN